MLELKDDSIQQSTDLVDDSIFDTFIERMPKDKSDRAAHHDNFNHMIRTIDKALKGCGPRGCSSKYVFGILCFYVFYGFGGIARTFFLMTIQIRIDNFSIPMNKLLVSAVF